MDSPILPIWKDIYYTTSAVTLVYSIEDISGNTLFSGKAIKAPDEDTLEVNINRIAENYLDVDFPLTEEDIISGVSSGSYLHQEAVKDFELTDGASGLSSYTLFYDWSYEEIEPEPEPPTPPTPTPGDPAEYLTFDIISGGSIYWQNEIGNSEPAYMTIQYSINNGSWTPITSTTSGARIDVSTGDKVRFKGTNDTYYLDSSYNYFNSSAIFNIEGNIMSLLYGDNFSGQTEIVSAYTFYKMFAMDGNGYYPYIIDASKLVMPATTLATRCYQAMFSKCGTLIAGPYELPATVGVDRCYAGMFSECSSMTFAPIIKAETLARYSCNATFQKCSSLSAITCLATSISAMSCTANFTSGVSYDGVFTKAAGMTDWPEGGNGIPLRWTVQDYVAPVQEEPEPEEELSGDFGDLLPYSLNHNANMKRVPGQYVFDSNISTSYEFVTDWEVTNTGDSCSEYVLYYLNRYGGWDSFVIEGKVVEKEEYEVSKYTRNVNNNKFLTGAEVRFNNLITKSYELNTGWLSDQESLIVASQLLSSNKVFFHNLRTDKIIPVTITDTQVDYKIFNNERKLISYQINVQASNKKVIK